MDSQELIDSELYNHLDSFRFPLSIAKEECWKQLQTKFTPSVPMLQQRQDDILRLRNSKELVRMYRILDSLKESEKILKNVPKTETETAAEGQIFFQGNDYKLFNSIPYLITMIVFLKIWIFPVLGLMTPILLFITPYILLQTMFGFNITWDMYIIMMKQLVFGIQGNEPWSLKHGAQLLWTVVSLGQGIVQPFFTSHHTAKLDAAIIQRGEALLNIHAALQKIHSICKSMNIMSDCPLQIPDIPSEIREAVAWMNDEPLGMKILWTLLGRYTILITLAHDDTWKPVEWTTNTLQLTELCDLAIQEPITSDVDIKGHCLLTGPNRGGKSSALRAILQQVILGQTFGFTRYATGSWNPFYKIHSRLKSRDTSGKESLFEMEVRNASRMIHSVKSVQLPALILIDELFHSTNPPDAETSAKVFLNQLWKLEHAKSIISTHIFSLCESPPRGIYTLCCPAFENKDGSIDYTYMIQDGVCCVSSVNEVLREAGLYPASGLYDK